MNDLYIEVIKKNFRAKFTYRANSLIYIIMGLLELLVQVSIWYALIGTSGTFKGISFPDMVNFIIINLIVNSLVSASMSDQLAKRIMDGSIAIDFIRPVSLKRFLIAENLGGNFYWTVFNTLPVCIVAILFLKFRLPASTINLLLFIISLLLGIALSYSINYILGLLVFWFKTGFHIRWILGACTDLFAGSIVPLWFYPGILRKIAAVLPFRLISFEPIAIYLGKVSVGESLGTILLQLIWIAGLILLERYIWSAAQKVVTVQGG